MRRMYCGAILAQRVRSGIAETFVSSFCLLAETKEAALGHAMLALQESHPSSEGWGVGYLSGEAIGDDLVLAAAAELNR